MLPHDPSAVLSFDVPACANPGARAREQLDSLAGQVDHATHAKLRLLVSELVNRAAGGSGKGAVPVRVTVSERGVHACVGDGGAVEPRAVDWALLLVRRMADRWGLTGGVWFELDPPQRRAGR